MRFSFFGGPRPQLFSGLWPLQRQCWLFSAANENGFNCYWNHRHLVSHQLWGLFTEVQRSVQDAFFEHPFLELLCFAPRKFGWVHILSCLLHAALGTLTSYHAAGMGAESRATIVRLSFVIDYRAEPKLNPTIMKHRWRLWLTKKQLKKASLYRWAKNMLPQWWWQSSYNHKTNKQQQNTPKAPRVRPNRSHRRAEPRGLERLDHIW